MISRDYIKLVIFLSEAKAGFLGDLSLLGDVFQSSTGVQIQEIVFQSKKSWAGSEKTEERINHGSFLLSGKELGATVFEFKNGYVSFNVDNLLSLEIVLFPPNPESIKNEDNINWRKSLFQLLDKHIEESILNLYIDRKEITGSMLSKYVYLKKQSLYGHNVVIEDQGKGRASKRNIALFYQLLLDKNVSAFSDVGVSIIDDIDLKKYDSLIKKNFSKKDLCIQLNILKLNSYRWFKILCI